MANFLVRVILHSKKDLSHYSYDSLHKAMEDAGFKREIRDFFNYKLPPAEYSRTSSLYNLKEVHKQAVDAANSVDSNNGVVTVEYSGCETSGLEYVSS